MSASGKKRIVSVQLTFIHDAGEAVVGKVIYVELIVTHAHSELNALFKQRSLSPDACRICLAFGASPIFSAERFRLADEDEE
jgi:hypothetical protein